MEDSLNLKVSQGNENLNMTLYNNILICTFSISSVITTTHNTIGSRSARLLSESSHRLFGEKLCDVRMHNNMF